MRQSQPNFVISSHQVWNEKESFFTDDELLIQNFGGPTRALHHQITTFLHITTLTKGDPYVRYTDIPLIGYYNADLITSDAVAGLLIKSTGYRNDKKMANLTTDLQQIAATNGYICYVEMRRYVKLVYSDLFDQTHVEYFLVAPIDGASRIPVAEASKWVDRFYEDFLVRGGLDFNKITAQNVWDGVMQHLKQN